jgi:hypothetical protein
MTEAPAGAHDRCLDLLRADELDLHPSPGRAPVIRSTDSISRSVRTFSFCAS